MSVWNTSKPASKGPKKQEVATFLTNKLRVGDVDPSFDVSTQLQHSILQLPVWQQVLLLEAGGDLMAAGQQETVRLYKSIRPDCDTKPQGFYVSGYNKALDATDAIVWYASPDRESMRRMTHELGHFTGELIAKHYVALTTGAKPWEAPRQLSQLPWWRDALEQQLNTPIHDAHLYEQRSAPSFKAMLEKYPPHERAEEAFAEIAGHYSMLMMDTQGNQSQVDAQLSEVYPILWPAFRDRVIPLAEALAERLKPQQRDKAPEFTVGSVSHTGMTEAGQSAAMDGTPIR